MERSRLVGTADNSVYVADTYLSKQKQISYLFSDNIYYTEDWHSENYVASIEDLKPEEATWRLKERMKTSGVALVVCLNIGVDPPDVVKPNPCARKQCWLEPSGTKQKGLDAIGNALQGQYEKWQQKAKFKQCLDPTSEELRKMCMGLRKTAKNDRLLFHYNGHGVPKPTRNGELWVFGKHYTHYTPVAIAELRVWLGQPAIYVLDCSGAGVLVPHLVENNTPRNGRDEYDSTTHISDASGKYSDSNSASTGGSSINNTGNNAGSGDSITRTIVLAACRANEELPFHPLYPADIFTACLTTPIAIAVRWFILQNPYSMEGIDPSLAENIPGRDNDRKTPRGELTWIFTAITDTIAWSTLPSKVFQKMFRQDLLVASLFRHFLLAQRIMKYFGCTPQSAPSMPDTSTHPLWQSWDLNLESCIRHTASVTVGAIMVSTRNNLTPPGFIGRAGCGGVRLNVEAKRRGGGGANNAARGGGVGIVIGGGGEQLQQQQQQQQHDGNGNHVVTSTGSGGVGDVSNPSPTVLRTSSADTLTPNRSQDSNNNTVSVVSPTTFTRTSNLSFFTDQLTAFELWLDFATPYSEPPAHLPIVLQVLLSQTHRLRALVLLNRYLSLGPEAVNLSLMVGIFPYVLKLLQNPAEDSKQILIAIWASIIGFDASCRIELVREKCQNYFVQSLASREMPESHRCMAAFVLAEMCSSFREGQLTLLQLGLQRVCTLALLQPEVIASSSLKLWVSLCLFKLCENFMWVKYLTVIESGHTHLYSLLIDKDPRVRTAALLALGEIFGASTLVYATPSPRGPSGGGSGGGGGAVDNVGKIGSPVRPGSAGPGGGFDRTFSGDFSARSGSASSLDSSIDLREAEIQLALQLLECCMDGAVMVRLEAVYALSKFCVQPMHLDCLKVVASAIMKRNADRRRAEQKATEALERANLLAQAQGLTTMRNSGSMTRLTSPGPGGTSSSTSAASGGGGTTTDHNNSSSIYNKINVLYPWHLAPTEAQEITGLVEQYLETLHHPPPSVEEEDISPTPTLSTTGSAAASGTYVFARTSSGASVDYSRQHSSHRLMSSGKSRSGSSHSGSNGSESSSSSSSSPPPPPANSVPTKLRVESTRYSLGSGGAGAGGSSKAVNTPISPVRNNMNSVKATTIDAPAMVAATITVETDPTVTRRSERSGTAVSAISSTSGGAAPSSSTETRSNPPTPPLTTLMASAYVRLWLALTEVQGKDPHQAVAKAAGAIRQKVLLLILLDNNKKKEDEILSSTPTTHNTTGESLPLLPVRPPSPSPQPYNPAIPTLAPMGVVGGSPTTSRAKAMMRSSSGQGISGKMMPRPSPFGSPAVGPEGGGSGGGGGGGESMGGLMSPISYMMGGGGVNRAHSVSPGLSFSPLPPAAEAQVQAQYQTSGQGIANQHASNAGAIGRQSSGVFSEVKLAIADIRSFCLEEDRDVGGEQLFISTNNTSITEKDLLAPLSSRFYSMSSSFFLRPDLGFEPYEDPLCVAGRDRGYRQSRLRGILNHASHLEEVFKGLDDRVTSAGIQTGDHSPFATAPAGGTSGSALGASTKTGKSGNKTPSPADDSLSSRSAIVAALPSNIVKFEQKAILNLNSSEHSQANTASIVMFHAFQDILAVSDGDKVGIWSLANCSRLININNSSLGLMNKNNSLNNNKYPGGDIVQSSSAGGSGGGRNKHSSFSVGGGGGNTGGGGDHHQRKQSPGAAHLDSAPSSHTRITAMAWMNESYDALLAVGSEDGVVRVWRDISSSNADYGGEISPPLPAGSNIELASTFSALPDIAETSRGSGVVMSWQQATGSLVVGGNSSTIRIWNAATEQCVRAFSTGSDTCVTTVATTPLSHRMSASMLSNASEFKYTGLPDGASAPPDPSDANSTSSWCFAGFADGSVGAYDERLYANGGRVHYAKEHNAWVISAHIRADVPEVITGCVKGAVKFWDLRMMRTYKTLEIQRSPLTALSVHNCAPVMAAGSHGQFIKILTLGGEQLGNIIKYHDGFLGQRIGPVSSLSFHPYRMLLATSTTDNIVSIYATQSDTALQNQGHFN